jgi:molybdenum cofactor synthesis domain-containing protein
MSTGNELVAPHERPGPGQIRDSNRFSLALAVTRAGGQVVVNAHVRDEDAALRAAFSRALDVADVIITSGGVSMGDRDLVKGLLGELAEVHIRRIFMKPGKPFNLESGDKLLFSLPGTRVLPVGFETFGNRLYGCRGVPDIQRSGTPRTMSAIHRIGISVRWSGSPDGALMARNTGSQISARLMSFVVRMHSGRATGRRRVPCRVVSTRSSGAPRPR